MKTRAISKFIMSHLLLLVGLLFVINTLLVWWTPTSITMTRDEYVFYRLTLNLPDYNTDARWLDDDIAKESGYFDPAADFSNPGVIALNEASYTTPVWIHPPAANYIAYPIARLFDNPVSQIKIVHLVCVAIILLTVALFVDIIRRRTNKTVAALSIFPVLISRSLLLNGIMLYHDIFMWFFFALTMWVIECKSNSRWIILLAMITVLTKLNAILLLIPIALFLWYKNKKIEYKVIVPSICAIVSFLTFQAIVAKDALYIAHHWGGALSNTATGFVANVIFPNIVNYIVSWGLFVYVPLLLVCGFLVIKNRARRHYPFVALGLITMGFAFGWAWLGYQVYPIMYASMFMIPITVGRHQEREG